jgi:hypothetical protein
MHILGARLVPPVMFTQPTDKDHRRPCQDRSTTRVPQWSPRTVTPSSFALFHSWGVVGDPIDGMRAAPGLLRRSPLAWRAKVSCGSRQG